MAELSSESSPRAALALDLGLAAHCKGDLRTALSRFTEAFEAAPNWEDACVALAHTYIHLNRIGEAFETAMACLRSAKPTARSLDLLATLWENYPEPATLSLTPKDFSAVLALEDADTRVASRLALACLARQAPLRDALALARRHGFAAAAEWVLSAEDAVLLSDEIFCRALRAGPNTDPAIEMLLTAIRRALALDPTHLDRAEVASFAEAMAAQCALNEFVWFAGADEMARIERPLLVRLYPPRTPARSAAAPFADPVSRAVAQQYEQYPYPPWTYVNVPIVGVQLAHLRALQDQHGMALTPDAPRVLIAGCGTGQQVVQMAAALGPNARILACDLSAASLDYAARKATEHGCTDIEFRQADILTLGSMEERFDIVVCTGVLHHMNDPFQGWRILTSLLKPGGAQYIALYSAAARAPLDKAHLRFPPDESLPMDARIRDVRRRMLEAHAFDWSASGIGWIDFFTLNGCRDLMFHAHETRTAIPRIADNLATLGLRFLDFALPSSEDRAFAAAFPDPAARRDLANWDAFERGRPAAFQRMYQFWCAKQPA